MGWDLAQRLKELGFSGRTANALAYSDVISTPEELRSRPWDDDGTPESLMPTLGRVPGLGAFGLKEIQAYRRHGNAKALEAADTTSVTGRVSADTNARIAAYAAARQITKSEAVRQLIEAGLLARGG